jgi:hypothetical protein
MDLPDAFSEHPRSTVGEVIAIDGGDDSVAEAQLFDRTPKSPGLLEVKAFGFPAGDCAIPTRASTHFT